MGKKVDFENSKDPNCTFSTNQCSNSAVFPIVRFAGDQKTALTEESLYFIQDGYLTYFFESHRTF